MCRAKRGPQWRRPKIRRGIVFNNVLNIYIYIYKFKTTKTTIFQSIKSYIFLKGLTHDFERKIQNSNFSLFVFGENTTTNSA